MKRHPTAAGEEKNRRRKKRAPCSTKTKWVGGGGESSHARRHCVRVMRPNFSYFVSSLAFSWELQKENRGVCVILLRGCLSWARFLSVGGVFFLHGRAFCGRVKERRKSAVQKVPSSPHQPRIRTTKANPTLKNIASVFTAVVVVLIVAHWLFTEKKKKKTLPPRTGVFIDADTISSRLKQNIRARTPRVTPVIAQRL